MRVDESKWFLLLACTLPFLSSCLFPANRVVLDQSGECPWIGKYQRVTVEGYFGIGGDQNVSTHGGYESSYPYAQFTFSAKPGINSKFQAAVVWANKGLNGPEKANRTDLSEDGTQRPWRIYDNQEREINSTEKIRITGLIIEDCVIRADKIEKL